MVGLPGSGKTIWMKSNLDFVIDCDDVRNAEELESRIRSNLTWTTREVAGIDTLITTNTQLHKIVEFVRSCRPQVNFIIHFWKENRELCLKNDSGRREVSAHTTIRNAPLEYPELPDNIPYTVVEHEVFEKSSYDKVFVNVGSKGVLQSQRWSTGGSWADCWGNEGSIEGEPPKEFEELDNLLGKICPSITFLQYKKVRAACVETETYSSPDYYGGCEHFAYWACDLKKLHNMLVEMELLAE
jgi:hypothetical protein